MNGMLRNLYHLMEMKIKLYERFIGLLREEWNAIAQYSLDRMQEIIPKKEEQVLEMQLLEKKRAQLMKRIAESLGHNEKDLSLKNLIRMHPDPYNERLKRCRKRLLVQITEVNRWSHKVTHLMDRSSLLFKKSMAFIHQADEKAMLPYEANGKMRESKLSSCMLSTSV
ncbi:MAG: flagellar protein FlgN [Nitrospinae bacterium CG11_big_fil_rev_8_21_14_0_20_56_8]|nr:MAG: flagellar protein FlgN [Nitrospinae bacterium CG11_big_fil_rev_8_21_14_0_20_56_8]